MGAVAERSEEGARQVEFRTGADGAVVAVGEDRYQDAAAGGDDAFDRAAGLAEQNARHMRPVHSARFGEPGGADADIDLDEVGAIERRVGRFDRAVDHRDADPGRGAAILPQFTQTGKPIEFRKRRRQDLGPPSQTASGTRSGASLAW